MTKLTRAEAYFILDELWSKATSQQREAINIAKRDIEFVDLLPELIHSIPAADAIKCESCGKILNSEQSQFAAMLKEKCSQVTAT